jgi:alpha-galactosidase
MNPVDLMTYRPEDGQPSIFFLREDERQSMLIVFNWTDTANSHTLSLREMGFLPKGSIDATDLFAPERKVDVSGDRLQINGQAPHSVRLIRLIDDSVPTEAPAVDVHAPATLRAGQSAAFRALIRAAGVPALRYTWDFGDGTEEEGAAFTHAYTHNGTFKVQLRVDGLDGKPAMQNTEVNVEGSFKTTYQVEDYRRYQGDDGMDATQQCWGKGSGRVRGCKPNTQNMLCSAYSRLIVKNTLNRALELETKKRRKRIDSLILGHSALS